MTGEATTAPIATPVATGVHIGFYNLPFLEVSGGWRFKTVGIRGVLTPRVCLVPATISYKRE